MCGSYSYSPLLPPTPFLVGLNREGIRLLSNYVNKVATIHLTHTTCIKMIKCVIKGLMFVLILVERLTILMFCHFCILGVCKMCADCKQWHHGHYPQC